jgi:GT2 family glycosyltransferase
MANFGQPIGDFSIDTAIDNEMMSESPLMNYNNSELKEHPLVTVVVPVYNHERFVAECLDSIINTRYPRLEIIIINDRSPDNSDRAIKDWITKHQDYKIRYINHECNIGLPRSLNEAIRLSQGQYFCHIAGDDVMLPNSITDRLEYFQCHPDKLAVFSDCHVMHTQGQLTHQSVIEDLHPNIGMRKKYLMIDSLLPYSIIFSFSVSGAAFMCRRELFDTLGFYDEQLIIEDWDMYIRCALSGKLGFCPVYVSSFRVHDKNMHKLFFSKPEFAETLEIILAKHLSKVRGLIWLRLFAQRGLLLTSKIETNFLKRSVLRIVYKLLSSISKLAYLNLLHWSYLTSSKRKDSSFTVDGVTRGRKAKLALN